TVDVNDLLPSLLRAWARIVGEHTFSTQVTPWWLDLSARMQAIAQAAETLGWQVQPEVEEEWDMYLTTPETRMVIRCVGAGVDLGLDGKGRNVIADAWRVLALTTRPPHGTLGLHLVVVEPHIAQAGSDRASRS